MVHAECVFIAGIYPFRTWTSGSLESVRWNACVHRLDLGLYSHPKEVWGIESEPMLTPREKSPLPEKFPSKEDRIHDAASSRTASPTHDQRAIPAPGLISTKVSGSRDAFYYSPADLHPVSRLFGGHLLFCVGLARYKFCPCFYRNDTKLDTNHSGNVTATNGQRDSVGALKMLTPGSQDPLELLDGGPGTPYKIQPTAVRGPSVYTDSKISRACMYSVPAADLGSIPAFAVDICRGRVIPVTSDW